MISLEYATKLNGETQKAQGFLRSYRNNCGKTIYDIYKRPSYRKVSIYNSLVKELTDLGYTGISCISGGSGYFSMGAQNKEHFIIITYANNYIIAK